MPRVLIVEDEPLISMLLEDWMTEIGYEAVGPVDSVEKALAMIQSEELDAAIIHYNLRGECSDKVAERLRDRGIPFAISTGVDSKFHAEKFPDQPLLSTPFDFTVVEHFVRGLVSPVPGASQSPVS